MLIVLAGLLLAAIGGFVVLVVRGILSFVGCGGRSGRHVRRCPSWFVPRLRGADVPADSRRAARTAHQFGRGELPINEP